LEKNEHTGNSVDIWAGVECSVVRLKNRVHDQLELSGHEDRISDLQLFADLGISTIRYPLLWEKFEKNPAHFFRVHDKRLAKLKELKINPVAGLLHHGSGPFFTSLLDPGFPALFAKYAVKIAQQYPWINYYTPINEPLTTARFSGLYGIWYPHEKSDRSFTRIFINEMKGIILAMEEIRKINPWAELVQTEDICKIHSTEQLKYQADFENHRRWLTYDFLTGNFNRKHPLWAYFVESGVLEDELDFFASHYIVPAIAGQNYYVTSERYLDHRKSIFPRRVIGGNGIQNYADVEVVRIGNHAPVGFYGVLKECWNRYHLPLALTEVHLGCTREEQLRWFHEAYTTAQKIKDEGVDLRAITAWSFLGSFDWDSLLRRKSSYEPGIFDLRSGKPRPTALADMIQVLQKKREAYTNSLIEVPGWWKRNIRVLYNPSPRSVPLDPISDMKLYNHISPVLITGGNGSLAKAFARICQVRGIPFRTLDRASADIASKESIENVIKDSEPWAIINAAGFSNIDEAEINPQLCFRENTIGAALLAEVSKSYGIRLVTFSTDQVFNGQKRYPYLEKDLTHPINKYGESKQLAEQQVMKSNPETLIIRSGSFFNPWHASDMLGTILNTSFDPEKRFHLVSDIIASPTYIADLVNVTLDLLIDKISGIIHLSNQEEVSHYHFAKLALNMAGLDDRRISSLTSAKLNHPALRPAYSVLRSSHGISLPPLRHALNRYLFEFQLEEKVLKK
jgi:dTDP-4-dehydrorhamnose reductase